MFPNPQDALPVPARPNLDHYKTRAKDLVKAVNSPDPAALNQFVRTWLHSLLQSTSLSITSQLPVSVDRWTDELSSFLRTEQQSAQAFTLARAQFILARIHGFQSWPKFARHLQALSLVHSPEAKFESAVEAIIRGELAALEHLLSADPSLVRARSAREHHATLLHYVGANGIEGYRQKTPKNILQIARLLLQAGAEVNASAHLYGRKATALDLVATSLHPEQAGVQQELMKVFMEHGASFDLTLVNACLATGRVRAAEFLAERGAQLDLESAAGLGRLDLVSNFYDPQGNLRSNANSGQRDRGFFWACQYGRNNIIDFLLRCGARLDSSDNSGQTPLHWAVIGGHIDTIKLLLAHGAGPEKKNAYGGTPLGQALWSALHNTEDTHSTYLAVIKTLVDAGARIDKRMLPWVLQENRASPTLKQRIAKLLKREPA
ncbi:MAG TPA: ankyrin repeat domain-containing protein [Candidatus Sulfotelmatobacter sp.]